MDPFEQYPASPARVAARADELLAAAARLGRLGDRVDAHGRRASAATQRGFAALFDDGLAASRDQVLRLKSSAVLVSGALSIWASAIADYNAGIDELNAEYAMARRTGGTPPLVMVDLRARHSVFVATLDEVASRVAGILGRGPSEAAIRRLLQHGALPLGVTVVLDEYDFSEVDVGELVRRLQRRGDLPYDLDPRSIDRAVRLLERLTDPERRPLTWNRAVLTDAWHRMSDLDPRAVDLVVLGLSDEQLTTLDRLVSRARPNAYPLPPGLQALGLDADELRASGLDRFDLADFHTLFLAHASADTLRRLQRTWPSIEPSPRGVDAVENGSVDQPRWRRHDTSDLFDHDPIAGDDIDQGAAGDCWMLAKLAALAGADPAWVREHVERNANGTVSVTFYDDSGDPHEVTVTDKLPVDDEGRQVFAGDDGTGARWVDYYEKAFALVSDNNHDGERGYGGIELGAAEDGARLMTGSEAGDIDNTGGVLGLGDHEDLDDIREHVEAGDPVVVGTTDANRSEPFVPDHQYYVKGFTADGDIILGNPWSSSVPDLVLTTDEFNDVVDDAAVVRP